MSMDELWKIWFHKEANKVVILEAEKQSLVSLDFTRYEINFRWTTILPQTVIPSVKKTLRSFYWE